MKPRAQAYALLAEALAAHAIRVEAMANGLSHWRLERLVESIVVRELKDNRS